jgi:hypothetical protein
MTLLPLMLLLLFRKCPPALLAGAGGTFWVCP